MLTNPNIALAAKFDFSDTDRRRKFFGRRRYLADALRDREAHPMVLNGAANRLGQLGLFSTFHEFGTDDLVLRQGIVQVSSALDLTGGVGEFVPGMPALNPESIRRFGKSKALQAEVLRPALGDAVPESLLVSKPDLASVLDAISEIHAPAVVVKPDFDPSKKIQPLVGTKRDVSAQLPEYLHDLPKGKSLLVQEFMEEVYGSFHSSLEFPSQERELLRVNNGARNEIRMYFVDGKLVVPYGRVDTGGADAWVFPEPSSLPERAVDLGRRAAAVLQYESGAQDAHMAVDVTPDGERIIEVNTRNIGVILPSEERPLQQHSHELMTTAQADKLVAMAQRGIRKEES